MRAFCTVSAPLEACAPTAEQLSPGSRFLALRLLGHQQPRTLYFLVDSKSRVREVYTQTCLHFSNQGMLDTELFGLAVLIDGEYLFADPESKLSKYGPKSWRSSHTHGLDANGRPLLELHFRVQFYIESPLMLKDEITRHNYYLQLKYNFLHRNIPHEYSEESMIVLTGLALQADLGDAPTTTASTTINKSDAENKLTFIDVTAAEDKLDHKNLDGACVKGSILKTATTTDAKKSTTTALPKTTHKHGNLLNERVLRLSSYVMKANLSGSVRKTDNCKSSTSSGNEQETQAFSTTSVSRGSSSASTIASVSTNASSHAEYFCLEDYLPPHLRTAWAASAARACHRENRGISSADAERHYIQHACLVNEFMNAHTFRMRMTKSEVGPGNSWFIVYPKGIKIFGGDLGREGVKQQITFLWPNITKLSFERKKFEIRSGENKITLYAISDEKNKLLLTLCKETHQFSMKMAARLKEVIKREEEENTCLQSNYIYSRSIHLPLYKNKHDQRISVISSTSSNTTSGIVSDRVHSEDELEIMINSPPAPLPAPTTESLALAYLLDKPSVSRQTSSIDQVSLKELKKQLVVLSGRQGQKQRSNTSNSDNESPTELSNSSSTENSASTIDGTLPTNSSQCNATSSCTESPTSQHNIGSQCSSTCSTVVVASSTSGNTNSLTTLSVSTDLSNTTVSNHRRNSTSTSLELGFSHTAQNSALSEPETHYGDQAFIPITRDGNESICGVYTLVDGNPPTETSGVYTMNSSELTGQSSEIAESEKDSCYNLYQSDKTNISKDDIYSSESIIEDAVDGRTFHSKSVKGDNTFRFRSDSNISTSDSFRGDGSDPTDNKHNLLSAEELTELIVGRGVYPKRKVTSNINDTDSDYITLPSALESDLYLKGHRNAAAVESTSNTMLTKSSANVDSALPSLRRKRSPPPYNATHNKTGLCGPPIAEAQQFTCKSISNDQSPVSSKVTTEKPLSAPLKASPEGKMVINSLKKFVPDNSNPPPYSAGSKPRPTTLLPLTSPKTALHQQSVKYSPKNLGSSPLSAKAEETPAKFITTKSQINILKAHTSLVNEHTKPSFATPPSDSLLFSSTTGSVGGHNLPRNLSQHSVNNCNYISASQSSLNIVGGRQHSSTPTTPTHSSPMPVAAVAHVAGVLPGNVGIPVVSYGLHAAHRSMSSLHQQQNELKQPTTRTCVLLPVIKPRQYLPPPPPSLPRQPPPPPPTQLNSLYSSPLSSKQLDLYQQQLYSDVDYVIYPIQDPVISQQEYLDAKQSSLLAAMAQTPPSHHPYLAAYHHVNAVSNTWDTCKGHAIYRSTPYLPLTFSSHSRYASTQNLSDTCVQLPSAYSPIYSPSLASMCSSFEPPPPIHPAALDPASINSPTGSLFLRSRSDDNILNSLDLLPKGKRLPPPPPPPYIDRRLKKPPIPVPVPVLDNPPPIPSKPRVNVNYSQSATNADTTTRTKLPPRRPITLAIHNANSAHMTKTSSGAQWAGERPKPSMGIGCAPSSTKANKHQSIHTSGSSSSSSSGTNNTTTGATAKQFDIELLREKSKHLDLPLISALCNDHSLLKQTNILENYKLSATSSTSLTSTTISTAESAISNRNVSHANSMANINDTVAPINTLPSSITAVSTVLTASSKLLTTSSNGNFRKTSISHRHPNDKLPPLPMQMAEANNYVMEPASMKHLKSGKPH